MTSILQSNHFEILHKDHEETERLELFRRVLFRVREAHNNYPVIHVDPQKILPSWNRSANVASLEELQTMRATGWYLRTRMPMNAPFIAQIDDFGYGPVVQMHEGNHTFCFSSRTAHADRMDLVVAPDWENDVRESFGIGRAPPRILDSQFLTRCGESLRIGLNLLQFGTILNGFVKKSRSTLNNGKWIRDGKTITTDELILTTDGTDLFYGAHAILTAIERKDIDLTIWVNSSVESQSHMLENILTGRR